jgi:hypothetical protein
LRVTRKRLKWVESEILYTSDRRVKADDKV